MDSARTAATLHCRTSGSARAGPRLGVRRVWHWVPVTGRGCSALAVRARGPQHPSRLSEGGAGRWYEGSRVAAGRRVPGTARRLVRPRWGALGGAPLGWCGLSQPGPARQGRPGRHLDSDTCRNGFDMITFLRLEGGPGSTWTRIRPWSVCRCCAGPPPGRAH